jgi:hypothetical protein
MPPGDRLGVLLSSEAPSLRASGIPNRPAGLRFVSRIHWSNTYNRNAQASKQITIKMMRFMVPGKTVGAPDIAALISMNSTT